MQTQYKVYDSSSTVSYTNHMIVAGLIIGSSLTYSNQASFDISSFAQAQFSKATNQTAMENKTLDVVNNAIAQQEIASFDFLHVDDKLDKEIDKYFSNYTGTDREILDI